MPKPTQIGQMSCFNIWTLLERTAAATFTWNNVCSSDCLFRHLKEQFPNRSWAVIYQHGYSTLLKDHLPTKSSGSINYGGSKVGRANDAQASSSSANQNNNNKSVREVCWKFNRGRCKYGTNCRYDHRCADCNKSGHDKNSCQRKETQNVTDKKAAKK